MYRWCYICTSPNELSQYLFGSPIPNPRVLNFRVVIVWSRFAPVHGCVSPCRKDESIILGTSRDAPVSSSRTLRYRHLFDVQSLTGWNKKVMECSACLGALQVESRQFLKPIKLLRFYANHVSEKLWPGKKLGAACNFDFWIVAKVAAEADVLQQQALWKHWFFNIFMPFIVSYSSFVGWYYSWFCTVFHIIMTV